MKNKWNSDYLLLVLTNLVITVLVVFLVSSQTGAQGVPGSSGIPGSSGPIGPSGPQGTDGEDGQTPYIGSNGNWWIGTTDTGVTTLTDTVEDEFVLDFQTNYPLQDAIDDYDAFKLTNVFLEESSATYALDLVEEGYIGVSTVEEFLNISADGDANYVLLNNVDFTGRDWDVIPMFEGVLDGAGFSLIGLQAIEFTSNITSEIALFKNLENAVIKNLVIDSFDFMFPEDDSDYNRNALFAVDVIGTTFANIAVHDSSLQSLSDSALLVVNAMLSHFYDISIHTSYLRGDFNVGGLVKDASYSTFIDIEIYDSELFVLNNQAGFVISYGFNIIVHELLITASYLSVLSVVEQGYVSKQNIALGFGYLEDAIVNSVLLENSHLEVSDQGPQESYYFYNIGGVVGFGYETLLSNVEVTSTLENMISFPSFDVINQDPVVEYVGGVAGYLNNYLLLNVVNRTMVNVSYIGSGNFDTIEAVAGVLGYSAGQGYFYNVLNEGAIFGSVDVGGVLGGVGFVQTSGRINMVNVANTGIVVGSSRVGGLIGSMDGLTSLSVKHAFQDGYVLGAFEVGGVIGFVSAEEAGIEIDFSHVVVRGFVYGLDVAGGFAGRVGFGMFNPNVGFITFSTIIIENIVHSMLVGIIYGEGEFIGFTDYFSEFGFFFSNEIGLVFGDVDPVITVERVFVVQPQLAVRLFTLTDQGEDSRIESDVEGYVRPVPYRIYGEVFVDRDVNAWFNHEVTLRLFSSSLWVRDTTGFTLSNLELSEKVLLDAIDLHVVFKEYIQMYFGLIFLP